MISRLIMVFFTSHRSLMWPRFVAVPAILRIVHKTNPVPEFTDVHIIPASALYVAGGITVTRHAAIQTLQVDSFV